MIYQDNSLCRVRTITCFLSLSRDKASWGGAIHKASSFCAQLSAEFQRQDYEVQSLRIVTNPFGEYLDTSSLDSARADLAQLSLLLKESDQAGLRIRFAIGAAKTPAELALLPELIEGFGDLCNACVNVEVNESGLLDNNWIEQSAQVVRKISALTPRGEGNFNFTVNFNCDPLIPYFPASYHEASRGDCFVVGLETPDLLVAVLKEVNEQRGGAPHVERYQAYFNAMQQALQHHINRIQHIINRTPSKTPLPFAGFDSSAAPSKDCASMTEVYELMGVDYFGAAGTVEASSLLTRVFKSIAGVDLVGFSGLMLALTEDRGLAAGSIRGEFDIRALLTYSAVCGIGLDTVPIPGDTPVEKIAALMRDTGTMAYRLNKPLTVRVFPVPGLSAGELTAFESDDLCNCAVLAVP